MTLSTSKAFKSSPLFNQSQTPTHKRSTPVSDLGFKTSMKGSVHIYEKSIEIYSHLVGEVGPHKKYGGINLSQKMRHYLASHLNSIQFHTALTEQ